MFTVEDFIDLAIDSFEVAIYDFTTEEQVFRGSTCEIPDEYLYSTVESFDPPCQYDRSPLCINIQTEED